MTTVAVQLPADLYHRAEVMAGERQCSLQALLTRMIEQGLDSAARPNQQTGLFADAPALMDEIVNEALADRERHWSLPPHG